MGINQCLLQNRDDDDFQNDRVHFNVRGHHVRDYGHGCDHDHDSV